MDFLNDIVKQVQGAPAWLQLAAAMILFALVWKKTTLPNKYLPFVNIILPTVVYPFLVNGAEEVSPHIRNVMFGLAFQGFLIGCGVEVFHDGIVAKLKARFPGLNFPDEPK